MSKPENNTTSNAILEAIRAKRDNKTSTATDIAQMEASLLADIENFDLDAAERVARLEYVSQAGGHTLNSSLDFPEIMPAGRAAHPVTKPVASLPPATVAPAIEGTSLLAQLRQQAATRQNELHAALNKRNTANETIDQALKQLFFFLHELVQQLNIVKPEVPRLYPLIDEQKITGLVWQEGFADYRSQAQSAGAMVEQVSFSYQLSSPVLITIERDGPAVDRFRALLFDYGLQFSCKEFRNERRYVERAEFQIQSQLSVSTRWRADFAQGRIVLETRNLERLGSVPYNLKPQLINQALLDEFGRMVLGQTHRFRELIRG